ncbi:MAG: TatD family hydrolase [Bacilli bacterium]
MRLIDTHCHLNAEAFKDHWQNTLQEAQQRGVSHCFVVGWDEASSRLAVNLAQQNPAIKAIIGVHPVDVKVDTDLSWIKDLYHQHPNHILAIGEIGLDYYWEKDPSKHEQQALYMKIQIEIANALGLPIVVHCRDAYEAILPILKSNPVKAGGVMHCYAGPSHLIPDFAQLGFYFSYGGPVTFKNAHEARDSVKQTPIDRILIETDSPYLSPHPFRGKPNSPTQLPIIYEAIQTITQTKELESILIQNTLEAFHVKTL